MPDERPSRRDQCRTWASRRAYNQVAPTRDGLQNAALSFKHVQGKREADFFAEGILTALSPFLEKRSRQAVGISRCGLEFEDALQIARIAVLKALEGWEPEKSSFWTFCYRCVGSALRDDLRKLRRRQAGIGPTLEIADTIPARPVATEEALDIARAMDTLPPTQRQVIEMRFLQGETLDATGKQLGLSRERARQIETEALANLRQVLGEDYLFSDSSEAGIFSDSSDACIKSSDAPDRDAPPDSPV